MEFGFSTEGNKPCSFKLYKSDEEFLSKLATHNLTYKADRSHAIAIRATTCSSRKFTSKFMRNDVILYQADVMTVDKETRTIPKLLDAEKIKSI